MTDEPVMRMTGKPTLVGNRRQFLVAAGLIAAGATAYVRTPRQKMVFLRSEKLETLVPKSFAGWQFLTESGLVLPPQDQLVERTYVQLLTRTYTRSDGNSIMLLIAYGGAQDGVVQIHRPEVCYPAGGYKLTKVDDHQTLLNPDVAIPSRYIVADSESRNEKLIYWTRIGNQFPRRWSEQRLAVFEQNLAGIIPDGVLVRISSIDPRVSVTVLDGFAADLYAAVGAPMRSVLTGR